MEYFQIVNGCLKTTMNGAIVSIPIPSQIDKSTLIPKIKHIIQAKYSSIDKSSAVYTFLNIYKKACQYIHNHTVHVRRHDTRMLSSLSKETSISFNIDNEEEFNIVQCIFEFITTVMYNNIDKYVGIVYDSDIPLLSMSIDRNRISATGTIIGMFKLFASGSLRSIVSQIKQSPYSLNEYLSNINNFKAKKSMGDCVICLCEIKKNQIVSKTECGHCFHFHCLQNWLQKSGNAPTCPHCRKLQMRWDKHSNVNLNIL